MAGFQCHIVAFEGRASFPLWARQGQATAPRRRRNPKGQLILERGICSYSQVLNFWYDAVREAIQQAGAIAWDQIPQKVGLPIPSTEALPDPHRSSSSESPLSGAAPANRSVPKPDPANLTSCSPQWVVYWHYYAQNHWRRAVQDIRQWYSSVSVQPSVYPSRSADPTMSVAKGTFTEGQPGLPCLTLAEESQGRSGLIYPSGGVGLSGHGRQRRFCIALLGFSNGGDAVYQTAKALQRRGIRVDLAITVDPVRKPLRGMGFMGFHRPENVARWINYYQRFDRRTLAGILPIVGRHVDGADENIRLAPEDFPDPKTRPKAHVWIPSLPQVCQRIRDEIVALLRRPVLG